MESKIKIACLVFIAAISINKTSAQAHTNDNLWYNNGAEVYIGSGTLVTVQGDLTTNQASVTGITHLNNNGFLWVQGNMYGDNAFKQTGTGTVRLQNNTALYTAPYATENYQVIQGGYRVNGDQSAIAASDDGSFYDLELDNQNGLVFIKGNTDVRNSVDFVPVSVTADGNTITPNGTTNRLLTYDPGTGTSPAAVPANGSLYPATFGMMNNAAGLAGFKHVSSNLEANTTTTDNGYIQGKLRRAIEAASGGTYGFPLGLEPDATSTASKGVQYTKLNFAANTYNVLTGYFERRSDNTDASPSVVCTIKGDFLYFGSTNHGEWIFNSSTIAGNPYTLTIYPQDFGSVSLSPKFFITKDNDVPAPGTQSCGTTPEGLSVSGLTGFSEFGFAGGTIHLPVTLKSFTYTTNLCAASLKWITATEENVKQFEIQHSINGINWTLNTTVPATGNSGSDKSYQQTVSLQSGVANFFRLKTVDFDGKVSYSPVNKISCNGKQTTSIYPNPVKDILTIQGLPEGTKQLVVYNAIGETIAKQATVNNFATVSFAHLPKGIYYMKVLSAQGEVLQTEKIVK